MLQSMKNILTIAILFSPLLVIAAPSYGNLSVAELHEVIDGDTIRVSRSESEI